MIAKNMREWIDKRIRVDMTFGSVGMIYVAAPPIVTKFINKLSQAFGKRPLIIGQDQLRKFVDDRFKSTCDEQRFQHQLHDFISQVEQELCTSSYAFISSDSSTWSGTIIKDRRAAGNAKSDISNSLFFR